jgi:threonine dehydratase
MSAQTMQTPRLSLERIEEASRAIDPVFTNTPQFLCESVGDRLGMQLVCKVETANPLRSFKGRGTDYFVHRLLRESGGGAERLVCASAGNFGQGLAYAARKRLIDLTVFAAEAANPLKVERMRRLGAQVILAGRDFDESKDAARGYAEREGVRFVEDGRDVAIAEGAGTVGLELTRWPRPFDAVLVPLGNGSLIAGVGRWVKAKSPHTQVIGVCAKGAAAMERSWRAGRVVVGGAAETIADGIAVRVPVPESLDDLRGVVDDVLIVDDRAIVKAMRLLFHELGLVIEPSGAAGVAAAMAHWERFLGKLVATPLTGGNVTEEQARRWLSGEE